LCTLHCAYDVLSVTEAGEAGGEKAPLSGIKVLDLSRSANEYDIKYNSLLPARYAGIVFILPVYQSGRAKANKMLSYRRETALQGAL